MRIKATLMTGIEMDRALTRIAHEIVERNGGVENLYIVGIQRRGVPLAERIVEKLAQIEGEEPGLGKLDITFYRDDLSLLSDNPVVNHTAISDVINDRKIILVDDVIYTGRTVRAAIEAIFDMGRPAEVQLACLIDRGHRELPFRPDYVGKNVPTSRQEVTIVRVQEYDGVDEVVLGELEAEENSVRNRT